MTAFKLINKPEKEYIDQVWIINDTFFTIESAERASAEEWDRKNNSSIICAVHQDDVKGFFVFYPVTIECGKLCENNSLREENLTADHILSADVMEHAQYIYVSALAVKDPRSILGRQCAAALMAGLSNNIRSLYNPANLKKLFLNPTTFNGYRFVRKLNLQSVENQKKLSSTDIHFHDFSQSGNTMFLEMEQRYNRFIESYEWR